MLVHAVPSGDTWIWYALPYAASHCRTTWLTVADAPRSTWIHCGSLKALDQRVPVLPSTAAEAGVPAPSTDEAVAGFPCDSNVLAALAHRSGATSATVATSPATDSPS